MLAEVFLEFRSRTRQWVCALHGHDNLLQFSPDRLYVRCASCGHETAGWQMDPPHYQIRCELTRSSRGQRPVVRWRRAA